MNKRKCALKGCFQKHMQADGTEAKQLLKRCRNLTFRNLPFEITNTCFNHGRVNWFTPNLDWQYSSFYGQRNGPLASIARLECPVKWHASLTLYKVQHNFM